jgi:hypothetical protein
MGSYEIIQPTYFLFKEIHYTWNNSCLDETLPGMAMVARSVGSWIFPMGSVNKVFKKNTTTKLDCGVSHEDGGGEKKNDDCPPSKTLKAPHFYRRRNLVLLAHFQPQNAHHASNLCSVIL